MHSHSFDRWTHDHVFGQDQPTAGERRTLLVVAVTAITMLVEIAAGVWTGSMALLADGVHMASHVLALGIAAFAYGYARRHARDPRYSFGTGKVNALSGFAGALLLAVVAVGMGWESVVRLVEPGAIAYDQAILIAILGLVVNAASAVILAGGEHAHHGHEHGHGHEHDHAHGGEDHTLRSAYLHVVTDALTSVLAIVALLGAKHFGAVWLDPVMGMVGAVLVAAWSRGLLAQTARVLLDRQAPEAVRERVRAALEQGDDRVADLHVWSIGPGTYAAVISLVSYAPRSPEDYHARIPAHLAIRHVSIEVHHCHCR
ncbi:CDF family Co(II)/Ni(II) efflux transporter DmeF [Azospirillum sp.]|uniref:CDF family Co(II)/Ni(II) efflux transporter DmeF n=1 Tax=Azospirillum sp. TaxID=34012 RepID=UPI003D7128C5